MAKQDSVQHRHHSEHTPHVKKGGGFFNSLFSSMGMSAGCCLGIVIAVIVIIILLALLNQ